MWAVKLILMSNIYLFNTLTKQKEKFSPLKTGEVSMYNCGPTVYDYVHIGNLRSFLLADMLRRLFLWNGYKVNQVMNITDVGYLRSDGNDEEDKMTKGLKRENKPLTLESMKELGNFYTEKFLLDLKMMNIKPSATMPKAIENITENIQIIEKLLDKGSAYKTNDGVYFDTGTFPEYGKLGNLTLQIKDDSHARVETNKEKKSFRDFALWKFGEMGFDATFGKGFPGWHIECSAMSMKYLGETFDIHTGGIDLSTTHHNNEIAQSESYTGKPFVRYWLHNAFVSIGDEKMAKSAGNFTRLIDLTTNGYSPIAYRLLLLQCHYRTTINFSLDALAGAQEGLFRIYNSLFEISEIGSPDQGYISKFDEIINDDLNTPKALALFFELLKSDINGPTKLSTALKFDEFLGLEIREGIDLLRKDASEIPNEIKKLAQEREQARKNKDFEKSDKIRKKISELGYIIEDSESGPKIFKK